jgi:hypothetical protein
MSYTFLLDAEEESSAECFSDIPASVLSRLNLTAAKCSCNGNETESCQCSQSGMMSEPLMGSHGEERLMFSAGGSPVRTSVLETKMQKEFTVQGADYGAKWPESFARLDRASHSWKIRQLWLFEDLEESLAIWPKWGWMRDGECLELETPEGCTNAIESGYLHLPTISKNEFKGSSRKRFLNSQDFRGAKMSEGLRTCEDDPTYLHPNFAEAIMGWPVTWTELVPLATDRFQRWLNLHGRH